MAKSSAVTTMLVTATLEKLCLANAVAALARRIGGMLPTTATTTTTPACTM
jgi:hypothetical protein